MRQFNEKPSKFSNIGEDIHGASRHHFDTYETTEEKEIKARKKASDNALKQLKKDTIASLTESNYVHKILAFEFHKMIQSIPSYQGEKLITADSYDHIILAVKRHIVNDLVSIDREAYNKAAKAFNRHARLARKIKYSLTFDRALNYFSSSKREAFQEQNGRKGTWLLESDKTVDIDSLKTRVRAVQFGNSLSDSERAYCLANLTAALDILETKFVLPIESMAFSFGARGRAGSLAHYEPSKDVMAFNRGIDGALIHELGHALDYKLGKVSNKLSWNYRSAYLKKLEAAEIPNRKYYGKPTEIFARLFEQWCIKNLEVTPFMQIVLCEDVMPELTEEIEQWMNEVLSPILRG